MALDLAPAGELSEATKAYFDKCEEKLGLVPNVLLSYAFDEKKLRAFTDTYNELMLGDSGLSKLEREMIAVVVSSINHCYYCLTAHGAAVRQLSGDPELGEMMVMNFRAADLSTAPARHARIRGQADRSSRQRSTRPTGRRCARPVSPTATSGTSPRPPPSSTCRTGWRRQSTCGPTTNTTPWRGNDLAPYIRSYAFSLRVRQFGPMINDCGMAAYQRATWTACRFDAADQGRRSWRSFSMSIMARADADGRGRAEGMQPTPGPAGTASSARPWSTAAIRSASRRWCCPAARSEQWRQQSDRRLYDRRSQGHRRCRRQGQGLPDPDGPGASASRSHRSSK